MEREFKVSTGMKIFYFAIAIFLVGFSLFLFSMSTIVSDAVMILPITILTGGILIFYTQLKRKIIVSNESIIKIGVFKTTEIPLQDIKGVRVGDKVITIESTLDPPTKINIGNYVDYSGSDELSQYLSTHYVDLNDVDYKAELNNILNDNNLGLTEEDRKARLKKAQYIAWTYNGGGAVCFFLGLIWDSNYSVVMLLILYPLLALVIIGTSKGLIKIFAKKTSPNYSVFIGIELALLISLFSSIDTYHIFQFANLWKPIIIVVCAVGAAFYLIDRNNADTTVLGKIIIALIIGMMFGFSSIIKINCAYDNSNTQVYHANVLDHRISHGKHTDYYITLSPWGPQSTLDEISISKYRYQHADIGSTVSIHFRKGLLDAPWFTISD